MSNRPATLFENRGLLSKSGTGSVSQFNLPVDNQGTIEVTANRTPPPHDWFVTKNKWRGAVQSYLACNLWTDEQVGRLLDALDAGPHAKNTVIVLYSDHGFHLGEKQRWAKQSL